MNVLYIGHYRESSGWGEAAQHYIRALDHVGINVYPQHIRLQENLKEVHPRIQELEQQDISNIKFDHCIQYVLPHYMKYDSRFKKNIGLLDYETKNIKHTSWYSHLKLMDEIWCPCTSMCSDLSNTGLYKSTPWINKPIHFVPHVFDLSKYNKKYDELNIPQLKNKFVFYFIGEFSIRKRLAALLRAFHTEFSPHEPVELVLKVNKPNVDSETLAKEVVQFCNQIKENLRLYKDVNKYKPEIVITVHLGENELMSLHQMCDCFVISSYGEGWCIPGFDSMAMGNIVVSGNHGGMADYINHEKTGYLVDGRYEPVFGQHETFPEFGTAHEKWFDISVTDLMEKMRTAYNNKNSKIRYNAREHAKHYDYNTIGHKMKELLHV